MVKETYRDALRRSLDPVQFASADSAPPRLSHPLPHTVAAQLVAVFAILSFALVVLFNRVPAVIDFFPERDAYFSRYDGANSIPIRLFVISFCIAFASSIDARWSVRLRFGLDLLLPILLSFALFDLCNAFMRTAYGFRISLLAIGIASGLLGMLIFSLRLIACADMPDRSDSPQGIRFKVGSLLTVLAAVMVAAGLSLWIGGLDLPIVRQMRDIALLGGVSVGVFLFIPLLFFLLNVGAAIQSLYRETPAFAPDVTVILPAYNEAHAIGAAVGALDTVAARYGGQVTLLVVDNNSTDATQAAAREAFSRAKTLHCELLEERRGGKAYALNRGLAAVETDFFARVDADTIMEPDSFRRAFSHFGRSHVGAVGGIALPPGGGPFDGVREIEIVLKQGYDQVALGAADCIVGIPGMFACYRTAAARQVGGFAEAMNGEDTDMSLRIGEDGYRLVIDPFVLFLSEVPRTYAHLREQRLRWFRSILHVSARNRRLLDVSTFSVRGAVVLPFMLVNIARRAMAVPLLLFATNFLVLHPNPDSTIRTASVIALIFGAQTINAIIAVIINFRYETLWRLPAYLVFRTVRSYLTLEAMLSVNYSAYSERSRQSAAASGEHHAASTSVGAGVQPAASEQA